MTDRDLKPSQSGVFDAVIVGAGFAGMYMLHRLRGMGLSVRVFEAGSGVGGTWYWNRYPGARCDVESMQYSYQFSEELQQEWVWSERYAPQPEILRYVNHVADRFDLRRDIQFNTRVHSATFDEVEDHWLLEVGDGERVTGTHCIMATGCLSSANMPEFAGIDTFQGETYHTGHWPHEGVDFSGKRVGVIGTGSSAIQSIPVIAQQAAHLHVFQRTPNYTIPAHNGPLDPAYQAAVKADYPGLRARAKQTVPGIDFNFNMESALAADEEVRQREFEKRWTYGGLPFIGAFGDLLYNQAANDLAAEFVRGKIREIVHDPEVAEMLSPRNVIGCKRLCVDTGYWETYNRPNVTLIDVSGEPIEAITPAGIRAKDQEYAVDAIVFATGFVKRLGKPAMPRPRYVFGPSRHFSLSAWPPVPRMSIFNSAPVRSWHKLIRTGERDLLTYLVLISLGASLLAACTGQWPYSPRQFSAPQSQASVSPPPSRPIHKHRPPPTTDTSGEVLARAEPAPAIPAPATPPGTAGPSPPDARATHSPLPRASELIGLDQPEVTRVLGAAVEQFERPPAMVWRYKNATCELDLFFYLDLRSNRLRTLHYAVKGDGGDPARRQDCLESLRVARSNKRHSHDAPS